MLVDYDDGELLPEQAAEVAEHLTACSSCARELEVLRTSLELVQNFWEEDTQKLRDSRVLPIRRRPFVVGPIAVAAACLAIFCLATATYWFIMDQADRPGQTMQDHASAEEIVRMIEYEGSSARLAASAQILSAQPGGQEFTEKGLRYLAEVYPKTAAGKQAARNVSSN